MNIFKNIDISSFLDGFASLLDLGSNFVDAEYKKFFNKSDDEIIKNDWYTVGKDIQALIYGKNK